MGRYRYLPPILIILIILGIVAIRSIGPEVHHHSDSAIMMDTFIEVSVWAADGTERVRVWRSAEPFTEHALTERVWWQLRAWVETLIFLPW